MHARQFHYAHESTLEEKKLVLTKALIRMVERFNLTRQELSSILGISESSLSRLFSKRLFIDPSSKEGQLTLLLLRLYRNLDLLFGGNSEQCCLWLRNENKHLNGIPIQLAQSIEGLVLIVQYLEAIQCQ